MAELKTPNCIRVLTELKELVDVTLGSNHNRIQFKSTHVVSVPFAFTFQ
jgi:hypothetical protein